MFDLEGRFFLYVHVILPSEIDEGAGAAYFGGFTSRGQR